VKQSVRARELPRNSDNYSVFTTRSLGASNSFTASCVRRSNLEETEIIYRKSARGRQALLGRCANFICGSCLSKFLGRIEATTYEQASHYPHPESCVAPLDSRRKD